MPFKYPTLRARLDANSAPRKLVPRLERPCRIWHGKLNSSGYPVINLRMNRAAYYGRGANRMKQKKIKSALAHRVSLADYLGVKLWQLNHVAHACDNKPCIEPTHLRSTTQKRNMADMVRRGRAAWQQGNARGSSERFAA